MFEQKLKKIAAEILWHSTSRSPDVRRRLRSYGMRIKYQWLGSRPAVVRLANGKTAQLSNVGDNFLTFELHWKGWEYFSPFSILTAQSLLRDCGAFLDLGANIGYYSLFAASERSDIEIVAFEPNPKNFKILSANAALNGSRIRCVHAAVSDVTGSQTFHLPSSDHSGSLEAGFNPHVVRTETVRTYRLDDYVAEYPLRGRPLCKAIVEGHEPKFIRGALKTLDDYHPDLILAVSQRYDDETVGQLRRRGYAFYQITNRGLLREEHLAPCQDGRWFFLEHLVTKRPEEEIRAISSRLLPRFAPLVLSETNTDRPDLEGRTGVW